MSMIISAFFLAVTIQPEWVKKAQEEIDRVIGTDRLPTASDQPRLPYVEAVVYECIRWNVPLPLGQFQSHIFHFRIL